MDGLEREREKRGGERSREDAVRCGEEERDAEETYPFLGYLVYSLLGVSRSKSEDIDETLLKRSKTHRLSDNFANAFHRRIKFLHAACERGTSVFSKMRSHMNLKKRDHWIKLSFRNNSAFLCVGHKERQRDALSGPAPSSRQRSLSDARLTYPFSSGRSLLLRLRTLGCHESFIHTHSQGVLQVVTGLCRHFSRCVRRD